MPTKTFSVDFGHCGTSKKNILPTLDKDCIRITTESKGTKVVLYLDKQQSQIEARLFESAETSTKYDSKITLNSHDINSQLNSIIEHLVNITNADESKKNELVDDLIDAVDFFINDKKLTQWRDAFNILFPTPQQKVKEEKPPQLKLSAEPVSVSSGGTIKRTRRHKKHKVIKKYTQKHKKNNKIQKSRRIQKRKQTHKRKLAKKSRKSRKLRK